MPAKNFFARGLIPSASFHMQTPQNVATSGEHRVSVIDTPSPTTSPATKENKVPTPQIAPAHKPSILDLFGTS
jgi:hypothetical protein